MAKISKSELALGAIYRVAVRSRIGRERVEALLASRCRLDAKAAKVLAGHWFTTLPLRKAEAA